jgi:acetyl-CoA C-acetyltransferase
MQNAFIYEGLRTPIGRYAGSLAKVRPDDMLGSVIKSLLAKSAFKAEQVEDIVVGCANQGGEDARCVARHAGLSAGLPIETPGTVLQRNCASGLSAVVYAAHAVEAGEGDVFLAGGVESMSRAPFVFAKSDTPFSRDLRSTSSSATTRCRRPRTTWPRITALRASRPTSSPRRASASTPLRRVKVFSRARLRH